MDYEYKFEKLFGKSNENVKSIFKSINIDYVHNHNYETKITILKYVIEYDKIKRERQRTINKLNKYCEDFDKNHAHLESA